MPNPSMTISMEEFAKLSGTTVEEATQAMTTLVESGYFLITDHHPDDWTIWASFVPIVPDVS